MENAAPSSSLFDLGASREPADIARDKDQMIGEAVWSEHLKRRDRRVVRLGEFTDAEIALIADADVPSEYAHLDSELKDWQP